MKILFFVSGLGAGGKERRLTELMKELKLRDNVDFELVVMSYDIHYTAILDLNIKIHYLIRKYKKDVSLFRKFYKLCKSIKPDIVHCWDSMSAVYSAPVCKFLHIKLVNGMIVDAQKQNNIFNKNRFRATLTFPFSTRVVSNSRAGILAYNAPESKSEVIYNGFNFNRIEEIEDKVQIRKELKIETTYVVGMVATFSKFKDYITYFDAAEKILHKRKDVTFLAIGHRTDSFQALNLIEKENLQFFRLLGTKAGIESYINAMDICVLATFTEGISNSILEYMALGKPVVATEGGGTNELIVDKETGFLVNVSNSKDMESKIESLLNNPDLRQTMGEKGNQRIRDVFSIERMIKSYIALYSRL